MINIYRNVDYEDLRSICEKYGNIYKIDGEKYFHDISPGSFRIQNSLSYRYKYSSFPYHTDTAYWINPAKYLVLYCKNPGSGNRSTKFISLQQIFKKDIQQSILFDNTYLVKKNFTSFYSRALKKGIFGWEIRFDSNCMVPMNKNAVLFTELMNSIEDIIEPYFHRWKEKDLIILDNRNYLHSRSSSTVKDYDRILSRGLIL